MADEPTKNARELLEKVKASITPQVTDRIVDRAGFETEAALKIATPKKWFGQVRNGWKVEKPGVGVRVVSNAVTASNGVAIMHFLEEGTANGGAGFIEPKRKKFLYVPLTRRAAGGWHAGLKYGKDYILKKRVRGGKPQRIIANELPKIEARLLEGMKRHIAKVLADAGVTQ